MQALVVYTHPEPTSFTAALRDQACASLRAAGMDVTISDLYAEGFNPVAGRHDFVTTADAQRFHYQNEQLHASQHGGFCAELQREQARVDAADLLVFVYPLWWGAMPAILKGWFDRVMAYGFAYADGRRFDTGFFQGRHAAIGLTTGGTQERFSPQGVYGPIEQLLFPHQRTMLEYLGLQVAPPFVAYASPRVDAATRADYLARWATHLQTLAAKVLAAPPATRQAALGAGHWAAVA